MSTHLRKILEYRRYFRYRYINHILSIGDNSTVLDVGCGEDGRSYEVFNDTNCVIGVDVLRPDQLHPSLFQRPKFSYVQGDASQLPFHNQWFDAAICIGVLEHITDAAKLQRCCDEIRRVAKKYAIVVPWRYAFIEPHFHIPLFPLLPRSLQIRLIRQSTEYFDSNFQWLSCLTWRHYLPGCKINLFLDLATIIIHN